VKCGARQAHAAWRVKVVFFYAVRPAKGGAGKMNPRNNSAFVRRSHSDKFSIADFDHENDESGCLRGAVRRVAERKRRRRSVLRRKKDAQSGANPVKIVPSPRFFTEREIAYGRS
jgi:hypothetical protein